MASQAGAMAAVAKTTSVVAAVNKQLSPAATAAALSEFQKQMETMNFNAESLDEFLEVITEILSLQRILTTSSSQDAFDDDEVEAEADDIVTQTLLGIGVDLGATMGDVPTGAPKARSTAQVAQVANDDAGARAAAELDARFSALMSS